MKSASGNRYAQSPDLLKPNDNSVITCFQASQQDRPLKRYRFKSVVGLATACKPQRLHLC